ncbi:MAG: putative manganese transporter [Desulfuromonadales bacterium]
MILYSLKHALMITGFVFVMMLVIEYLNVLSRGVWQETLRGGRWRQYLLAAALGVSPGCLGAFAVVSLYMHRTVTPGAVVAAMIATSGDESFVMLAMPPNTAGMIFFILFLVECFPRGQILSQLRSCSLSRGVLLLATILFTLGLITGEIGPEEWNWVRWTLLLSTMVGLFIVATVPDHFLESHLWEHVVKTHIPRILAWTFGALLVMHLLLETFQLTDWLQEHSLLLLLSACLLGLIPESGPHLVFLTLYIEGALPFSVLLASSIVQDGHGMLPLLADSRRDFLRVKLINFAVGLLIGLVGIVLGW